MTATPTTDSENFLRNLPPPCSDPGRFDGGTSPPAQQGTVSRPGRRVSTATPKCGSCQAARRPPLHSSASGNERCRRGGHEEVLPMGRRDDRVEALGACARRHRQLRAVRQHPVHRQPVALEVVAGRVEHDEVHAGDRGRRSMVALRIGRPRERVVERVEVGALRDRGTLRVDRPVVGDRCPAGGATSPGSTRCGRSGPSSRNWRLSSGTDETAGGPCATVCVPSRTCVIPGRTR